MIEKGRKKHEKQAKNEDYSENTEKNSVF